MKRHTIIIAALTIVGVVALWRWLFKTPGEGGHASPDEAMSYGWAVWPRGLTGWREIGPHGEIVDHDTGGENLTS